MFAKNANGLEYFIIAEQGDYLLVKQADRQMYVVVWSWDEGQRNGGSWFLAYL